jgi:Concanavalin A-like lectin/glucanases superfamily
VSTSLILLVPLLILPVVLLFAFAGCALAFPLDEHQGAQKQDPDPNQQPPAQPPPSGPPTPPPATVPYEELVEKQTPGLVAYWRLGDPYGSTGARDSSGHGLDGVYQGGVILATAVGALAPKESADRAAEFNGIDAYVEVDPSSKSQLNPSSFSVEAWIRPQGGPTSPGWVTEQCVVSSHNHAGGVDYGFELRVIRDPDPNAIQGIGFTGVGSPSFGIAAQDLPGGFGTDWLYLVVTYNNVAGTPAYQTLKLYVGAVEIASTPTAYAPNTASPLRIAAGRQPNGNADKFFNGLIDEVALYNVALGAQTIQAHFAAAR